jgi:hypothetical protein
MVVFTKRVLVLNQPLFKFLWDDCGLFSELWKVTGLSFRFLGQGTLYSDTHVEMLLEPENRNGGAIILCAEGHAVRGEKPEQSQRGASQYGG